MLEFPHYFIAEAGVQPTSIMGPVLGAVIAFIAAIAAPIIHKIYDRSKEIKGLKAALFGEINSLYDMIIKGGYRQGLNDTIEKMENEGGDTVYLIKVRVQRDYFHVYENNASKIGLLDPSLSKKIPAFYITLNSLLEDVDGLYGKEHDDDVRDDILNFYKSMSKKFNQIDSLAVELVQLLEPK